MLDAITRYDREVPREWTEELERAFPPNEWVSWLRIVWQPEWQRWAIYQVVPLHATTPFVLDPEPAVRANGTTRDRVPIHVPMLGLGTRQVYRDTGCFSFPIWVIQGEKGGHQWQWDEVESAVSEMYGGPLEPPIPGSLPYAEFDQRVLTKLVALDRLRVYKQCLSFWERSPDDMDKEDKAVQRAMRSEMWRWLSDQVDAVVEENRSDVMEMAAHLPRTPGGPEPDWERMEEDFLETPI